MVGHRDSGTYTHVVGDHSPIPWRPCWGSSSNTNSSNTSNTPPILLQYPPIPSNTSNTSFLFILFIYFCHCYCYYFMLTFTNNLLKAKSCALPCGRLSHFVPMIFSDSSWGREVTQVAHTHKVIMEEWRFKPRRADRRTWAWNLTWYFPSHQAGMGWLQMMKWWPREGASRSCPSAHTKADFWHKEGGEGSHWAPGARRLWAELPRGQDASSLSTEGGLVPSSTHSTLSHTCPRRENWKRNKLARIMRVLDNQAWKSNGEARRWSWVVHISFLAQVTMLWQVALSDILGWNFLPSTPPTHTL